jgi:hypothetical protein
MQLIYYQWSLVFEALNWIRFCVNKKLISKKVCIFNTVIYICN